MKILIALILYFGYCALVWYLPLGTFILVIVPVGIIAGWYIGSQT